MNKKINELIPRALEAIKDSEIANSANEVEREYKGYIASMGASIIQSGLIATLAFYSNEQSQAKDKRLNLLAAIMKLINQGSTQKLLNYVLSNTNNGSNKIEIDKFEKKISTSLVALKLALRTYKQKA